jgi:hypothetical protein
MPFLVNPANRNDHLLVMMPCTSKLLHLLGADRYPVILLLTFQHSKSSAELARLQSEPLCFTVLSSRRVQCRSLGLS